MGRMGL
ncbi:hypothetical protein QC761_0076040 [Podospora bellae-mahoneyi]|nr:hypothetical protein QC761_0076040 [Podospora bellae-mahoneyi]